MFMTFLLLLGLTLFFILIGRLIAGKKGMVVAFIIALVMNGVSYWYSDSIVLRAYNAKPAPDNHRLERITKELVKEADMPLPKVYIIPGSSPNAFATGRSPEHAAVAATEGILKILNDDELKGVVAHELGHVYNRDTLVSTVSASIAGGVMILSRMALFFGGGRNGRSWLKTLGISLIAPVAATVITMAISRTREYMADEFAAKLTGRPMDLASALAKLSMGVRKAPMKAHSPETAHMFIVHPFSVSSIGELFSTHPPIEKRIERLKELSMGKE